MESVEYEKWVSSISCLTPAQRKDVQTRLLFFGDPSSSLREAQDEPGAMEQRNAELFYNALKSRVERYTGGTYPNLALLKVRSLSLHKTFMENYSKTHEVLVGATNGTLPRGRVGFVYKIASNLILEDLERTQTPLSLKTAIHRMDRVPGLLDRAFPGYIRSGIFGEMVLGVNK